MVFDFIPDFNTGIASALPGMKTPALGKVKFEGSGRGFQGSLL
jgi:hypothetical protein